MSINYTKPTDTCQQLISNSSIPFNLLDPNPTMIHPIGEILALEENVISVLNVIIRRCLKYRLNYSTQLSMAKEAKVSLATFKRILGKLEDYGLVAHKFMGVHKPCWYKISTFFNDTDVRKKLSTKIRSFFKTIWSSVKTTGELLSINVLNFIYKDVVKEDTNTKKLATLESQKVTVVLEKPPTIKKDPEKQPRPIDDILKNIEKVEKDIRLIEKEARNPQATGRIFYNLLDVLVEELKKAREYHV